MRVVMVDDEFDQYFARAEQQHDTDMLHPTASRGEEDAGSRRGSLPSSQLRLGAPDDSMRRVASCKYPSRRQKDRATSRPSRANSRSPSRAQCNYDESQTSNTYIYESSLRAPSPGPATKCHSAPHSRSSSVKNKRRPRGGSGDSGEPEPAQPRSRSGSTVLDDTVSAQLERIKYLQTEDCCPVRSFQTSSRGLINRGDSFKRNKTRPSPVSSRSDVAAAASKEPTPAITPEPEAAVGAQAVKEAFKVLLLGDHGVGKTALLQQFTTSEYMGAATEGETLFEGEYGMTLSVQLDGVETTMDIIDVPHHQSFRNFERVDAYIVVFSITERPSFLTADDLLRQISRQRHQSAVILVANKIELARSRQVSDDEARTACNECTCKYIEVSAAINHKVDELLVGIARQIRLNPERGKSRKNSKRSSAREGSIVAKSAKGLMDRLFRSKTVVHKSGVDNLSVL